VQHPFAVDGKPDPAVCIFLHNPTALSFSFLSLCGRRCKVGEEGFLCSLYFSHPVLPRLIVS
jgi:hypothetical protein